MPMDSVVLSDKISENLSPSLLNDETLCQRAQLHDSSHQDPENRTSNSCNTSENLTLSGPVTNGNSGNALSLALDDVHRMETSGVAQSEKTSGHSNEKKAPGLLLLRHHHHRHSAALNFSPPGSDVDITNHLASQPSLPASSLPGSNAQGVSNNGESSPILSSNESALKTNDKGNNAMNPYATHGQLGTSYDAAQTLLPAATPGSVLTPGVGTGAVPPPPPQASPQQPLHPFHQLTTSAMHGASTGGILTQSHAPTLSPSPSTAANDARVNPGNVSEFELARRLGVRFDSSNAAWVARWVDSQNDRKKSRWFSIAKYGNAAARRLAIQACLHNMKPSDFLNLRDLQEVLKTFNTSPPVGTQAAGAADLSHLTDTMGSFGASGFPGMMRASGLMDVHAMQAMGLFGATPGTKLAQYSHPHLLHQAHQQQAVAAAVAANPFGLPGFPNSAMAGYMAAAAAAAAAAMPPGIPSHPAAAAALAGVFCPQLSAQQQQLQNFAAALQHQHQLHQQASSQVHSGVVQTPETHVLVGSGNEMGVSEGMGMNTLQPKPKKENSVEDTEAESPIPFTSDQTWNSSGMTGAAMVDPQCKFSVYDQSGSNPSSVPRTPTSNLKSDMASGNKQEMTEMEQERRHVENGVHTHQMNSQVSPSMMQTRLSEKQFLRPLPPNSVMTSNTVGQDTATSSPRQRFVLSDNSLSANEEENSTSSSPSDLESQSEGSLSSDEEEDGIKNENEYAGRERKKRRISREANAPSENLVRNGEHGSATPVHGPENIGEHQPAGAVNTSGLSPFGFFNPAAAAVTGGIQNAAAMAAAAAAANHLQSSYYPFYPPAAFNQQQPGNNTNLINQTHPSSPQNHHAQSWMLHQQQQHGQEQALQHASLPFLSAQFNLPMLHPHLQSSHHAAAAAAAVASGGFFPQAHHPAFDLVNVHNGSYNQFLKGIGGTGGGGSAGNTAASSGASPRPTSNENDSASFAQGLPGSPSQQMMSYGKRGSINSIHQGLSDSEGDGTSSVNGTQTAKMTCERGLHYSKNYQGSQECWIAVWNTKGGRIMHEAFDVTTLGYETAKNKAREARDAAHSNNVAVIENCRPSWKSHSNTGIPHVSLDSQQLRFRAHKFGRRLCRSFSFGRRRGSYTSRESAFDAAVLWLIQSPTEEEIAAVSGISAKIEEAL